VAVVAGFAHPWTSYRSARQFQPHSCWSRCQSSWQPDILVSSRLKVGCKTSHSWSPPVRVPSSALSLSWPLTSVGPVARSENEAKRLWKSSLVPKALATKTTRLRAKHIEQARASVFLNPQAGENLPAKSPEEVGVMPRSRGCWATRGRSSTNVSLGPSHAAHSPPVHAASK